MKNTEHDINNLIDINLALICKSNSKEEYYTMFIDENGNQIDLLDLDPKTVALEMKENGLIWMNGENCKLKSFGQQVCKNGGWLKHMELEKEKAMKEKEENGRANITNNTVNVSKSKIGKINQDLDRSPIQYTKEIKDIPNKKPDQKHSLAKKVWGLVSNNKLITMLIGLVIEEITIGVIWKTIMRLFVNRT